MFINNSGGAIPIGDPVEIPPGHSEVVMVKCPPGMVAMSGGYRAIPPPPEITNSVTNDNLTGWDTTVINPTSSTIEYLPTVVCSTTHP